MTDEGCRADVAGAAPRVPPLEPAAWSEKVSRLLERAVPGDRPGGTSNFLATLARDESLLRLVMRVVSRLLVDSRFPRRDRELLVLRSAWLCRCAYVWGQHLPLAREAELTSSEVEAIVTGPDHPGWGDRERALLRAVDQLHETSDIQEETWVGLQRNLSTNQLLELPMLVGLYHLIAWTQNTVRVPLDIGFEGLDGR